MGRRFQWAVVVVCAAISAFATVWIAWAFFSHSGLLATFGMKMSLAFLPPLWLCVGALATLLVTSEGTTNPQ